MTMTFTEMISSFEFSRPWLLCALVVVPMAVLWRRAHRRRGVRTVVTFTGAELLERLAPTPRRRRLPLVLAYLSLAVAISGFAGPRVDTLSENRVANVMLVMDTSYSMSAKDVTPTRLTVAQDAAKRFIGQLPDHWRAGLVAFNEVAVIAAAPTDDRAAVISAIDGLRPDRGTATGDGVNLAINAGRAGRSDRVADSIRLGDRLPDPSKTIIVLLSDGEETGGIVTIEQATERANRLGITVHTIAMGTDKGQVLISDGSSEPQLIRVPPDRLAMQAVATKTGGRYFEATELEGLEDVYESVTGALETEIVDTDVAPVFGAVALLLVMIAAFLALRRPDAER